MKSGLWVKFSVYLFLVFVFTVKDVFAMHLSEGILPAKDAIGASIIVLPFLLIGLKKIADKKRKNPLYFSMVGLLGAAVFVISAFPIPVPIAGTCSHPAGTGLSAIILGPFPSVVVAAVALLIQALFMAHGGLTTLGANILTMGVCGSFFGYFTYKLAKAARLSPFLSGFLAGVVADVATYSATAFVLAFSLSNDFFVAFKEIGIAFVPTQVPLSILEGVITGLAVKYVIQNRPDLFEARVEMEVRS